MTGRDQHVRALSLWARVLRCLAFTLAALMLTPAIWASEGGDDEIDEGTDAAAAVPDYAAESKLTPSSRGADPEGTKSSPSDQLETAAEESSVAYEQFEKDEFPLLLLGSEVPPGTSKRLSWAASESFEGIAVPTPVLVVNGAKPGPVLCLTAAVHGDELNGVEMVRRIIHALEPENLQGAVIGVPIVNLQGFRRATRYLPDRRDLNRYFPGNPKGSSAARIAHSFFENIIGNCSYLVDLHTGSFYRTNLPQLRADLRIPEVADLTHGFGSTVVLHSVPGPGTLRRAATEAGIPSVTLEAGEPMRLQPDEVDHGVSAVESLLNYLGMVSKLRLWGDPEPVYYESRWVRANHGGILLSTVELGERVKPGRILGTITDPITNKQTEIHSPSEGRVLGMAINQFVMPGFAAFRIGVVTSETEMQESGEEAGQPSELAEHATEEDPVPSE